jgi:hypothetical protein
MPLLFEGLLSEIVGTFIGAIVHNSAIGILVAVDMSLFSVNATLPLVDERTRPEEFTKSI